MHSDERLLVTISFVLNSPRSFKRDQTNDNAGHTTDRRPA